MPDLVANRRKIQVARRAVAGRSERQWNRIRIDVDAGTPCASPRPRSFGHVGDRRGDHGAARWNSGYCHMNISRRDEVPAVLPDPLARHSRPQKRRSRGGRHGERGVRRPGDDRVDVGLAVDVDDRDGEGLTVQVAVGVDVEVGRGGIGRGAVEFGDVLALGVDAVRPRCPERPVDSDGFNPDAGREVGERQTRVLDSVRSDGGAGADAVVPVLADPARRSARASGIRRFGSAVPPSTQKRLGRRIRVGQVDLKRPAGLGLIRFHVEVGRAVLAGTDNRGGQGP